MKKRLFKIIIPLIVLFSPIMSFADTKDMSVTLTDEYSMATFYLDFAEEGNYKVIVTTPSGLSHETVIEGSEGSVSVSDIENGTYKVSISSDSEIEVKSRVECKRTEVSENIKDINVSTVVSGLKIYFKDTDLCIEWDKDSNEEAINIEVTEPTTMQILDSLTVRNNFYSLDFDETFKQLIVYIVPAKSSNVDGAGNKYTVDVVLDNKGRVYFPSKTLYNTNDYSFNVSVLDGMRVFVEEDSKEVFNQTYSEGGDYEVTIPLNDIKNHITVWTEDAKGNLNSFNTVIDRDIEAPTFKIDSFDTVTKDGTVTITGSVTETTSVFFNDFEVATDEYGRFSFTNNLVVGDNPISISATDLAGNVKTLEYVVTRKEVNYTPLLIVAVLGLIFVIVGVRVKRKPLKQPKRERPEKVKPERVKKVKDENTIRKQRGSERKIEIKDFLPLLPIFVFAFCLLITVTCLLKNTTVASGSMEPTLKVNNICLYNKLAYKSKSIERGDIICFDASANVENALYSKRVIGLPGDEISFHDGYVFINGLKCEESYIDEDIETNCIKTFEVPEGCVFVMGDNRENSCDSRFWENPYVPISNIYGKYIGQISKLW